MAITFGRTYMDIPETDGQVIIKANEPNLEGTFVNCKITGLQGYDLIGVV